MYIERKKEGGGGWFRGTVVVIDSELERVAGVFSRERCTEGYQGSQGRGKRGREQSGVRGTKGYEVVRPDRSKKSQEEAASHTSY